MSSSPPVATSVAPPKAPGPTELVHIPHGINIGLKCPMPADLEAAFGAPRNSYSAQCQPPTNAALAAHIVTRGVGRFSVTGLLPAVESLARVMADITAAQPQVYALLGSAGMLCCRKQRGKNSVSSHSWGTAVDLKLAGELDARGDSRVQYGLTLIAPIFNRHGWYWGAGFRVEDAMHFEAGLALVKGWGLALKSAARTPLKKGDKGPRVLQLQQALNGQGAHLVADGSFGPATDAAVRQFQTRHHLQADGIAGDKTLKALGL